MEPIRVSRRELIMGASALLAAAASAATQAAPGEGIGTMRLGRLRVSRLLLGSNPFFGFSHTSPALDEAMRTYFNDERITALLDEAAGAGITAVVAPVYPRWMDLWKRYRDQGGRLRTWIAQPDVAPDAMVDCISQAVKAGAQAVWVQGHRVENTFAEPNGLDTIRRWVEHIKSLGVPAGLASHQPHVLPAIQKAGLPVDFYSQSLYVPDQYTPQERLRALETIRSLRKPVIAYKVLAAGRMKPEVSFPDLFRHLQRKDGVCVGIFPRDHPGMLAEDVRLASQAIAHL
ncbi:MAG: hypothetical protein ACP5VE_11935 [Chthonomonadales bacterium]